MRYLEILNESVGKYRPMFNMFAVDGKLPEWVDVLIRKTEDLFKREDRVVWALRWGRLSSFLSLFKLEQPRSYHDILVLASHQTIKDSPIMKKFIRDLCDHPISIEDAIFQAREFDECVADFVHLLSLPIHKIQSCVFAKQLPVMLLSELRNFEEEWQATRRQIIDHKKHYGISHNEMENDIDLEDNDHDDDDDDDEDEDEDDEDDEGDERYPYQDGFGRRRKAIRGRPKKYLDFGNGWAWWDLNRAYCQIEGGAMGHCGNSATPQEDDTVLSLRRHIAGDEYRPSLTFILHDNGYLGEMKGRANEKPKPEYHDMIVALLKSSDIKGIDAGGYQPEKNFSILDLPESVRKPLLEEKPDLLSPIDALEQWTKTENEDALVKLQKRLGDKVRSYGLRYEGWEMLDGDPVMVIRKWKDKNSFIRSNENGGYYLHIIPELEEFLNEKNLAENIEDRGLADEYDSKIIAQKTHEEYYNSIFKELFWCDVGDFALDGVTIQDLPSGEVLTYIGVRSLINPSGLRDDWGDDYHGFILDNISSLDEIYKEDEMREWENIRDVVATGLDDLGMLIAEYVYRDPPSEEMETRILNQMVRNYSESSLHYFSDDPRQQSFDLSK